MKIVTFLAGQSLQLDNIVLKNLRRLFDKYTVARTEQDTLFKSTPKIFSNFMAFSENPLWSSPPKGVQKNSTQLFYLT